MVLLNLYFNYFIGASLAQLTSLIHLDLSHNFLRSLSAEPLKSLRSLAELFLHDNDVSMIDDGALALHKDLGRFTIEGNGFGMIRVFYRLTDLKNSVLEDLLIVPNISIILIKQNCY